MVISIGQLMKCLRDKGRIPRGYNEVIHTVYDKKHKMIGLYKEGKKYLELVYKKSLRDLCAKESGLWQFVCENALYSYTNCVWKGCEGPVVVDYIEPQSYQYRLIESALKDDGELEELLLQSIVIDKE